MRGSAAALSPSNSGDARAWRRKGLLIGFGVLLALVLTFTVGAVMHAMALHRDLERSFAEGRFATAQMQIQILQRALELYRAEHGAYPTDQQGLAALESYFGGREPRDPWGRAYVYRQANAPQVLSWGSDGKPGGEGEAADVAAP